MVNKVFNEITALDSFTDPSGTTHTGSVGGGGTSAGNAWNVNGTLAPEHDAALFVTNLSDGQNLSVGTYSLLGGDTGPVAGNVALTLVTFDGSGSTTAQATIQSSDGTSVYVDETSEATYTNQTGGSQSAGVIVSNGNSTSVEVFTSGSVNL
jgi:hypothetical protein